MSDVHGSSLRRRRWGLGVLLVGGLLVSIAACGVEAGEKAAVATRTDSGDVVGSDVSDSTTTEATTTTLPPAPDLEIEGVVDSETNTVIANAIADLEEWWADAYPEAYGDEYQPLTGGLFAIDSATSPQGIPCAGPDISQMLDNAYYCPPDDAVVWDQEGFMPSLAERYGLLTVAVVVAHEWGHVIQERSLFEAPSVIVELQADCFAGAWAGRIAEGDSDRFSATIDDLDQALAGILSLRDAPGGSADDPYAHGSGFDRVGAFQDGFESGVSRCAEYDSGDPAPYQWPFTDDEVYTSGDLPFSTADDGDDILDLTFPSLDAYWTDTFPELADGDAWDPLDDPVPFEEGDAPDCGGEPVDGFLLFVCIPDRFVGFQVTGTIPDAYDQNGDFAVSTLIATQYGLDIVEQLGSADTEVEATLQGDCFAGSWAAAILPPDPPEAYQLVLSPGDLDEGVAVLLSFRSEEDRARQGPGFDRVRAFRLGVLEGAEACPELSAD